MFSVVVSAKGMMENLRSGHAYTALSLRSEYRTSAAALAISSRIRTPRSHGWKNSCFRLCGRAFRLSGVCGDNAACRWITSRLTTTASRFTIRTGNSRFSADTAAPYSFNTASLQEFLIRETASVPARLGAILPPVYGRADQGKPSKRSLRRGTLPYLPVHLGDPIPDLIAAYRLVRTPDQYPGGRYFQLEDAAIPPDADPVRRADAGYEFLRGGRNPGDADESLRNPNRRNGAQPLARDSRRTGYDPLPWMNSTAADYGLPVGTADYYTISGRQLMLYADENGVSVRGAD